MPEDKGQILYQTLSKDSNYSGLGKTYDSFKKYFSDPNKAQMLFNTLSQDKNYTNVGNDFNSFIDYFGLKKKETSEGGGKDLLDTSKEDGFRTVAEKGSKPDLEFEKPTPSVIDMQKSEQMLIKKQAEEKQQRKLEEEIYKQIVTEEKAKVSSMLGEKVNVLNNIQSKINFNQVNLKELSRYNELNPNEFGVQEELTELSLKNDELLKRQEQESKNITYLKDAKYLINKTDKFLKSDRTGMSGWLDAVKNTALTKDFATLGISRIIRNFNILEIAKKQRGGEELTPEENQSLVTYGLLNEIRSNVDTGLGAVTGEAMVEMIPYLVSFAVSGGTGKAVESSVSGLLNVASKKGISAIATKTAAFLAGSAARIPFFESLYSGLAERQIGGISVTRDIDMKAKTIEGTDESFKKALVKSIAATGSEIVTEQFGERLFPKVTKMFGKGNLTQNIEKSVLDRVKSTIGFDGFVSEMGEEFANKVFMTGLEGEPAEEIFDMKEFMSTALTIGVMSGTFQGINLLTSKKVRSEVMESKNIAEGELDTDIQKKIDKILNSESSTDEKASDLVDFINKAKEENATKEDINNIIQYSQYKVAEDAMLKTEEVIKEEKAENKLVEERKEEKGKEVPLKEEKPLESKKTPEKTIVEEPIKEEPKNAIQISETKKALEMEAPEDIQKVEEEVRDESKEVPTEKEIKGITFKDKVFETEEQIKESLNKKEITVPEYEQATQLLNKKNFDIAKEKLRNNLDKVFTKQAIGEEPARLSELYDSLVEFIKQSIKLYGDKIKSAKDVAKYANVKYNKTFKDAYNEAIGRKILSSEEKMRGFPKRIKEFDEFKNIKLDIEKNPELYYEPQNLKLGKEKLENLSNEELVQKVNDLTNLKLTEGNDNLGVLAGIELINRYRKEGKDIMPVLESLSKSGTAMGQLIRQFGELKGSVPEGLTMIIEKNLERQGRYLTEEQKTKLTDLADKDIKARQQLKDHAKKTKILFTEENINEYKKLKKQAEDAYIELAQYIQTITPNKFWDNMGMILQGNLLTPMSQITNIYANLMNIPLTSAANTIATPLDVLHTMITGKPRETTAKPRIVYEAIKGFGYGIKEATKQMITGVPVQEKAELTRGFKPLRAIVQAFSGKDMPVDIKGKTPLKDRVNKFIEGTAGLPAEVMFRLLNLGDKPFYRMGEQMALYRIGTSKGLKGEALRKFIMFPDIKSSEKALKTAKELTFQEESLTAKLALGLTGNIFKSLEQIPGVGGAIKFLARTQMPYIKTPANIISQTLDFALPPISIGKAAYYAYKNNKRDALVHIGKAGVGIMIGLAAEELLKNGIISGSPDEEKKKRNLQYEILPPNSINMSALNRLLNGEDPTPRKGDEIVNYTKMGIIGMTLGVKANIYSRRKEIEEQQGKLLEQDKNKKELSENAIDMLSAIIEIPSYALEQSFLKGTSSLLVAINDKQWDYWLNNTFNAISSIPLPNTLASINRATREYIPDLKGDNIEERLSNVVRNKLFMTDDLALIVNLWGEPVKQTPEGSNAWLYQLFDVTKSQELELKPESKFINDLYKRTEDSDVLPSVPSRNITVNNKTIRLDSKQYQIFLEEVGKMRYNLLKTYISEESKTKVSDESKIDHLKKLWDKGLQYGRAYMLVNMVLKEKAKSNK